MFDFTQVNYETLLQRCLRLVPDSVDKREGSVIYDALAPACAELAIFYSVLSGEMDRAFPDTAEDIDLTNKAKERGIFRLSATQAIRRGSFFAGEMPMEIPIGSRFSGGDCNYIVTERLTDGEYMLQCEESGAVGNRYFGTLFPIDFLPGLTKAELLEILIPGEDEEDDETLRERYMQSLKSEAFGGNIADYREKVEKLPGVGQVKVFPVWNGGGTVKLALLNSENALPSAQLIDEVQTAVDPEQNQGEGLGIAPIGHRVTVEGAEGLPVTLSFLLTLEAGYTWEGIRTAVETAAGTYFAELAAGWADAEAIIVRISQLESRILDIPGVVDITGTKLNGAAENLMLSAMQIPILGEVTNDAA